MYVQTLEQSPRNHIGGRVSFLLMGKGQFGSKNLAINWVEATPGSEQPSHSHSSNEQTYVIVRGHGHMTVGDEIQEVGPGTVVFVPPNTNHSIRNGGDDRLVYVSATSPPFEMPEESNQFAYSPPQ